ncbi:hypothetical protein M5K25_000458 [Dendrobium thyrsiflorum]|uniref:CCHC-type domain-containing protein n=1 Tax=Dendrobium thyrsiflorum TaxID=117978 RepID=A0ABD0VTX6_DENTH
MSLGVWVEGLAGRFFQKLEYEKISFFCYECGRVGHVKNDCCYRKSIEVVYGVEASSKELSKEELVKNRSIDTRSTYGPWVHVNHKKKKKNFLVKPILSGGQQMLKRKDPVNISDVNADLVDRDVQVAIVSSSILMEDNAEKDAEVLEEAEFFRALSDELQSNIQPEKGMLSFCDIVPIVINKFQTLNDNADKVEERVYSPMVLTKGEKKLEKTNMANPVAGSSETEKVKLVKELKSLGPVKNLPRGRNIDGGFKKYDVFFVGIVETKISCIDRLEFNKFMGKDWDFFLFPSEGSSGGIMINGVVEGVCSKNWPNPCKLIDETDVRLLEADFTHQEIMEVIANLGGNKAPGIDGRMMLIKSIFLAIPLFLSTHVVVPLSLLKEFAKMSRNFIWNKYDGGHELHYVAWEVLCKAKDKGGRGLFSANGEVKSTSSSSWKVIWNGWKSLSKVVRWKIALGSSINVLRDVWILDKSLEKWPTFFAGMEDDLLNVDAFIKDGIWNSDRLKMFFGEELWDIITSIRIYPELIEDRMELKFKFSGRTISAMTSEMEDNDRMEDNNYRNCVMHGGREYSVVFIAAEVLSFVTASPLNRATSGNWGVNQRQLSCDYWHPPPPEWIKINIDASLLINNKAGVGGVL